MNKERNIHLPTQEDTRLKTTLRVLNGIMGLTEKELEVVHHFLMLSPEYPCGAAERKIIYKKMGLKNVQALNNVIRSITNKKIFEKTGNGYKYSGIIYGISHVTRINISLV